MVFCKAFRHNIRWNQRTSKYTNELVTSSFNFRSSKRAVEGLRAGGRATSHLTTNFYGDVTVCSPSQLIPSWKISLWELLKVLECFHEAYFLTTVHCLVDLYLTE
jgi:hypothetical protein